jgi:thiol:disulfide interchange protein
MRASPWIVALLTVAALGACARGGVRAPTAPPAAHGGAGLGDLPLESVLASARASGRPALLYFQTSWCGYCRLLEGQTLPDARVAQHLAAFTFVRYDAEGPVGRGLAQRYGVVGYPTLVRVDGTGAKVAEYEGYNPPAEFVARIPRP